MSPLLIEEVFSLRDHFSLTMRNRNVEPETANRVGPWLQEMAALAASQRVSQAVVNKLLLFIRGADQSSRDSLAAVFNSAVSGQLRDGILSFLDSHRASKRKPDPSAG